MHCLPVMQAQIKYKNYSCKCFSPEVSWLISMRSLKLGHEDPEDIEEEKDVAGDAEKTRKVGDPLHPHLKEDKLYILRDLSCFESDSNGLSNKGFLILIYCVQL